MRYLIIVSIFLMSHQILFAQTRRMNNTETGRTYAVENQSRTIQPLLQKADRQFRQADYEGTFLTLESAVAQNPNSAEALLLRARFKKLIGMQTESQADLKLANRINPQAANLYGYNGNNGLIKIISLEPELAVQGLTTYQKLNYYYQALDKKVTAEGAEDKLLNDLELIIENIESDQTDQALISVNELLEEYPESAIAYDLKGIILKKKDRLEDAVTAFSTAVEIEPSFAIAWYNLGQIERNLGNFDQAKIYLDKAIKLQSDLTKAYFERAMLHKQMGNKESALDDYNSIIEINGDTYMEAFLNRGLTKKMLGDFGGALADLNQAIEEFPNNAELRKNRGNLQLLYGLTRKAIDDYTKAIQLNNDYAEAYYNRGLAFLLFYDKISACADLTKSADLGYEAAEETKRYFCTE